MRYFTTIHSGLAGLCLFFCFSTATQAQNSFPSSGDAILDGSLEILRPDRTTGWARGVHFHSPDGATRLGGIGMEGGGANIAGLYIAVGSKPWNTTNVIYLQSSGNVGIGTESPTAKLAVDGTTKTKEIIVTEQSTDWPDYVFAKGYKLSKLSELEGFIGEHGHLPGIPSKGDIRQYGQNLGEIQAKLLEKIEELTLHMIELNKENSDLRMTNKIIFEELDKIKKGL